MALPSGGTVTKESFHAWLKARKVRRDAEKKKKRPKPRKRERVSAYWSATLYKNSKIFVDGEAGQ